MDEAYCRVVELGVDDRHTQGILEEAARERARIVEEEQARPRGRGRGR